MIKRKSIPPTTPHARRRALLLQAKRPRWAASSQKKPWTQITVAGKTLWDWLSVILIPVMLAIYTLITTVNMAEQQNSIAQQQTRAMEQQNNIADEQLKSQVLESYTSTIQGLLLHENLLQSRSGDNVQIIATTQTALALRQLDKERKAQLLLFIYQTRLIDSPYPIIHLIGADLSFANLNGASLGAVHAITGDISGNTPVGPPTYSHRIDLGEAILSKADLSGAGLNHADLGKADLREANLSRANLGGADLADADLTGADLGGAKVTDEQLKQAASLQGAIMPDGSIHP